MLNYTTAVNHVNLFINFSYPLRWTDEEKRTVRLTIDTVGQSDLHSFGTLVINNGHEFKVKYPENTLAKFKDYLIQQASKKSELKEFLNLFRGSVMILDTELEDQEFNGPQLQTFYSNLISPHYSGNACSIM